MSSRRRGKPMPDRWRVTRALHLAVYPECRVCDVIDEANHVHHIRYRGPKGLRERPGDLVTLCEEHHYAMHDDIGRTGFTPKTSIDWINQARFVLRALM